MSTFSVQEPVVLLVRATKVQAFDKIRSGPTLLKFDLWKMRLVDVKALIFRKLTNQQTSE
jgi:hypothetical protein